MTKCTKISSFLILLLVLLCLPTDTAAANTAWDGSSKAPTAHYKRIGSGDSMRYELEYYTASTPEQLAGLRKLTDQSALIYLTKDKWFNTDENPIERSFSYIGMSKSSAFTGAFDGQGHIVHNLYIDTPNSDNIRQRRYCDYQR